MPPDERARAGVFLAFQYPVELPGIRNREFLRTALEAVREARGEPKLAIRDFNKLMEAKALEMEFDPDLMKRNVNEGFSGGEKKRNEILQLSVLDPKLALLDETDSGLDIDALKVVSEGVNRFRGPEQGDRPRHPLPAHTELHHARLRSRPDRRTHRPVRRTRAGPGTGVARLRVAARRRSRRRRRPAARELQIGGAPAMTQAPAAYNRYMADFETIDREVASQPTWLRERRRDAIAHFRPRRTCRRLGRATSPGSTRTSRPIAGTQFAPATPRPSPSLRRKSPRWCPGATVWKDAGLRQRPLLARAFVQRLRRSSWR